MVWVYLPMFRWGFTHKRIWLLFYISSLEQAEWLRFLKLQDTFSPLGWRLNGSKFRFLFWLHQPFPCFFDHLQGQKVPLSIVISFVTLSLFRLRRSISLQTYLGVIFSALLELSSQAFGKSVSRTSMRRGGTFFAYPLRDISCPGTRKDSGTVKLLELFLKRLVWIFIYQEGHEAVHKGVPVHFFAVIKFQGLHPHK
jgi:hypothetical protein